MTAVKMYTTAVCPYCVRAKQILKSKGVEQIEEVRIDLDPASIQPREVLRVAPGEPFEVGLTATPGLRVQARRPGGVWQLRAVDPSRPGRYAVIGEGELNGEPLARRAGDEQTAGGRPIQGGVAADQLILAPFGRAD